MSKLPSTPPFESLPLKRDGPPGNAWGLYGENNQLGMLIRLTPENTIEAAKSITHGIRISLDLAMDQPKFPYFQRAIFHQEINSKAPRTVNDDILTFNTQSSTQWDGFRHYGYQEEKVFFNGVTQEQVHNTLTHGIDVWAENGGIVGRGVLLDYGAWAQSQGLSLDMFSSTKIPLSDILKVAEAQHVTFKPGDILFIRSGYTKALTGLTTAEAEELSKRPLPIQAIGVEACKETLKWMWDTEFAAVAGDMLSFESYPLSGPYMMHQWALAGWGLPLGELFDLERLASECKRLDKWDFFFSSVPLKVPGGVASPPCSVAIL
ncbi:uncharacterized protein V1518DRAFT_410140 [Limtongia smithiae]|uniref:uncharacterized protein n=1 Tax=Limtongia smithiae TaxID=1125753 RepID=UPI0034CF0C23